ncbi:MAG: ion transporter [Armatimonadetes bacterium]|nr:ion transporter [Armatimonadota bacterium]
MKTTTAQEQSQTPDLLGGLKSAGDVLNDLTLAPIGAFGRSLRGHPLSWWIERFILALVLLRFGLYMVETDFYRSANSRMSPAVFLWSERFIASVLTIEYFVRWRNSRNPRMWPRKPTSFIDLLSFLPFWLGFFVPASWLGAIRAMRVLSLLKFYRHSPKAQELLQEIWRGRQMIRQVFMFNLGIIVFFGAVVYEIEKLAQPDKFARVVDGLWYSVVTASTTGYGDLFPVTPLGKAAAVCFIFVEIAFMSIYIGMFSTAANRAFKKELEAQDALTANAVP